MDHFKVPKQGTPVEAALLVRVQLMRDTIQLLAVDGVKDRVATTVTSTDCGFVKADPSYYAALADMFFRWANECPEHAIEQVAKTLAQMEELAFTLHALQGLQYFVPEPRLSVGYLESLYRAREAANNEHLGLS